ncbi:hypothetical protein [Pseudomonas caspiana]|uniref:hypothetical protein n=1 Tax=Pseudomonas caspiana TaxID=1451454 RepID=UPI0032EC73F7
MSHSLSERVLHLEKYNERLLNRLLEADKAKSDACYELYVCEQSRDNLNKMNLKLVQEIRELHSTIQALEGVIQSIRRSLREDVNPFGSLSVDTPPE